MPHKRVVNIQMTKQFLVRCEKHPIFSNRHYDITVLISVNDITQVEKIMFWMSAACRKRENSYILYKLSDKLINKILNKCVCR